MSDFTRFEDIDPEETREWIASIDSVLKAYGPERAHFLLESIIDHARRSGAYLPFKPNTAYDNTISPGQEAEYPGDRALERRIEALLRRGQGANTTTRLKVGDLDIDLLGRTVTRGGKRIDSMKALLAEGWDAMTSLLFALSAGLVVMMTGAAAAGTKAARALLSATGALTVQV